MILFDLRCTEGHCFEAWFKNSDSFDNQCRTGEIACPYCGTSEVRKALMAPTVRTRAAVPEQAGAESNTAPVPVTHRTPTSAESNQAAPSARTATPVEPKLAAMLQTLRAMQRHIVQHYEHVGPAFAEEARKIHYGERDKCDIYGEASAKEAEALRDEGIEIAVIPWLPEPDA